MLGGFESFNQTLHLLSEDRLGRIRGLGDERDVDGWRETGGMGIEESGIHSREEGMLKQSVGFPEMAFDPVADHGISKCAACDEGDLLPPRRIIIDPESHVEMRLPEDTGLREQGAEIAQTPENGRFRQGVAWSLESVIWDLSHRSR